jgi:hypothetical protein
MLSDEKAHCKHGDLFQACVSSGAGRWIFVFLVIKIDLLNVTGSTIANHWNTKGPRTKDQGPRSRDQGPRTKDQGPRTKDQGPRTKDQGPRSRDQRPRSKDEGPRTKDQGPETRDWRPGTRDQGLETISPPKAVIFISPNAVKRKPTAGRTLNL